MYKYIYTKMCIHVYHEYYWRFVFHNITRFFPAAIECPFVFVRLSKFITSPVLCCRGSSVARRECLRNKNTETFHRWKKARIETKYKKKKRKESAFPRFLPRQRDRSGKVGSRAEIRSRRRIPIGQKKKKGKCQRRTRDGQGGFAVSIGRGKSSRRALDPVFQMESSKSNAS